MYTPPAACVAGLLATLWCPAVPVEILNPSGEINNGVDRVALSDPSVIGWDGSGGTAQVIGDRTDFGNGKWRLSIEDSAEAWQMTSHVIAAGDSFSLRFDAAMFAGNLPGGGANGFVADLTLVGPGLRNGDFNEDTSPTDSRSFADTPEWTNLTGNQNTEATRTTLDLDGSRNAVLDQGGSRQFAVDTGHTLAAGEVFQASFAWRDAFNWNDAQDTVEVTLYTTADDTVDGAQTVLQSLNSPPSTQDGTYEQAALVFAPVPATATGKRLFVSFQGADGDGVTASSFGRLDNFTLQRGTTGGTAAARQIIAELYVEDGASRLPVAGRTYDFKTPVIGAWDHYHLAVPAGALDAHAGKALGVRFRSNDEADGNFQSFDNVRLDTWPTGAADGSFSDNWDTIPNQTWAGPGYWANRLQDWEVNNGRVQCIEGGRDRLTVHRTATSIRGNGGSFSLSVRTGLHAGSQSAASRSGFLLGGAPNVDWRGALLVHDGLGRDFGLFLGMTGNGDLVIEDYGTGSVSTLASTATAGLGQGTRLELDATYDDPTGTYTLALEAFDAADVSLGTTSLVVPSDRVLGAFGLLNHRGSGSARYWFDDFSGSGPALQPEPDRHLAILGAMHTLSGGTLRLTAQLPPLDLGSTPPLVLETWTGTAWQQAATAAVDNTDNYSSYTATFEVPGWNDTVDTDYRVRITHGGADYTWRGTVRRDPVDREELVLAMTTCQRITDTTPGRLYNDGFDWTPVQLWQPHTLAFRHIARHDPDVLLAHGDQIYEGEPTQVDTSNLQLDYLYKWFLWVLQVRELSREIPTIAIPDDHDIYQGNLWGEGGVSSGNQNDGGYTRPAVWVKMVERTQVSNLPPADPYNPVQPAPPVAQGIEVYFTGVTYGRLGFAVLEDRKFKTGPNNPPSDLAQQFLLGDRQEDFLRAWNTDWAGQDVKLVVSQSPMGNLRTHAGSGYGFFLNDKDTHGWPVHRRNEAWQLWRKSRMFQLAGDQHLATLAHHGVDQPRDAGLSFTAPAIANFFPRAFDPVHDSGGTTPTVSPYLGDYFFDGNGTLPDGATPNRTANDPHHFAILGAGNPAQYYQSSRGINPANLHDRGAGYGITRVNKATRRITFECWPLHADPEFPQTGGQFPDWPQTFRQTDNDGRVPTGYLPVIDTHWRLNPVVRVFDETGGELVHAMRIRGSLYRPPVFDNGTTYRVEIAYGDETVSELRTAQAATPPGAAAINRFAAVQPAILAGRTATLEWDVSSPTTLTIDQGIGDVLVHTVDGIGYLEVSPAADTTYTLTLDGGATATATVRVFPGREAWDDAWFTPAEQADPLLFGGDRDPDGDGFTNDEEFQFQTNPRDGSSRPALSGAAVPAGNDAVVSFDVSYPVDAAVSKLVVETGTDLVGWSEVPANTYVETARTDYPPAGTPRLTVQLTTPLDTGDTRRFYRALWLLN